MDGTKLFTDALDLQIYLQVVERRSVRAEVSSQEGMDRSEMKILLEVAY